MAGIVQDTRGKVMSLLPKKKPAVSMAAPAASDTYGTTDRPRDGLKVDGRTLRATGRTVQFNTRLTPQTIEAFEGLAAKHRLANNALLTEMVRSWADRGGVPEKEQAADRDRTLTVYASVDTIEALDSLAKHHKASIHAVLEDLVAERLEKLQGTGDIPKVRKAAR